MTDFCFNASGCALNQKRYTCSVLKAVLRSPGLAQADKDLGLVLDSGIVNNEAHGRNYWY